jgi:ParB family chromosome partitioning protein
VRRLKKISLEQIREPEDRQRIDISRESIDELALSLTKLGLLQPILVRKKNDHYEIEAGHRRYLAAKQLNWHEIDCIVLDKNEEAKLHLERAHENLIRENLNPVEEARCCWKLVYEDDRGVERTAALLCKTIAWVENRLDILRYPEEIINAIAAGKIKLTVAKELARVKDIETRQRLLESAVSYGASGSTVAKWVEDMSVSAYLENKEIMEQAGQIQAADMGQVTMQCFVCQNRYIMDYLRHIWLCPDCRALVYQLQRATAEEMQRQDGRVE